MKIYTVNHQLEDNYDEGDFYKDDYSPGSVGFTTYEKAEAAIQEYRISDLRVGLEEGHAHLNWESENNRYDTQEILAIETLVGSENIGTENINEQEISISYIKVSDEVSDKDALKVVNLINYNPYDIYAVEVKD